MASNYTSNYNLCQWAAGDRVLRTEFNADNAKIDAALAGKASSSGLDSLKSTVDGLKTSKADKSALDSLSATVSAQGAQLAQRNCMVHLDSYTGDGQSSRTFTFSAKPWLVAFFRQDGTATLAVRGLSKGAVAGSSGSTMGFSWSGNSVTVSNAPEYLNYRNQAHTILAILEP